MSKLLRKLKQVAAHEGGLPCVFLALSVIPSLKLTDRGLVDVDKFELVPLEVSA